MPPKSTKKPSGRSASAPAQSTPQQQMLPPPLPLPPQVQQPVFAQPQTPASQTVAAPTPRLTRNQAKAQIGGSINVDVSDYSKLNTLRSSSRRASGVPSSSGASNQPSSRGSSVAAGSDRGDQASVPGPSGTRHNLTPIAEAGADTPIQTIERDSTPEAGSTGGNSRRGPSPTRRSAPPIFPSPRPAPNVPLPALAIPTVPVTPVVLPAPAPPPTAPALPAAPSNPIDLTDSLTPAPPAIEQPRRGPSVMIVPPPDPDPGAPFWQVFVGNVYGALEEYICRWRTIVAIVLAYVLLTLQFCSLGNICSQKWFFTVLQIACWNHTAEFTALFIANFLTISGLMEIFEGFTSVLNKVGVRAAHKEAHRESPEPVNQDDQLTFWQNFWTWISSTIWKRIWEKSWEAVAAFAAAFIALPGAILQDVYDEVMEPVLMLTMTFALRWLFGSERWASSIQLVYVSLTLHLMKWSCNAIVTCYGMGWWPLFWSDASAAWLRVRNRLFILVLLILATTTVWVQWGKMSLNFWEGHEPAKWFYNTRTSANEPMGRVRIEQLPAERPWPAKSSIHRVTNIVVTKWVEPTQRM